MKRKEKFNQPPNTSKEIRTEMPADPSDQPITNMIHQANFQSGTSSNESMKKHQPMKSR